MADLGAVLSFLVLGKHLITMVYTLELQQFVDGEWVELTTVQVNWNHLDWKLGERLKLVGLMKPSLEK